MVKQTLHVIKRSLTPPSAPVTGMTPPSQSANVHAYRDTSASAPPTESASVGGSATHHSAIPETSTDTSTGGEAIALDTRIFLQPTYGTFRLRSSCSSAITGIFQGRFKGAYSTLKDVPMEEEKMWWEEFTKRYRWAPEHEEGVKRGWGTILKRRLSGIMSDARKKDKKPKWVSDTDWTRLQTYWETPEFKAKSKQTSINRKEWRGGEAKAH